jgi:hypothetical protein
MKKLIGIVTTLGIATWETLKESISLIFGESLQQYLQLLSRFTSYGVGFDLL